MFRFLRGRSGALLIFSLLVFVAFTAWRYLGRSGTTLVEFDQPKLSVVALEGIPLLENNGQPVDVMVGEPVKLACQRVSPKPGKGIARFHFDYGDGTADDLNDCDVTHAFKGQPGQVLMMDLQYLVEQADGTKTTADRYRAEVRLIAAAPFFRLRGFGTAKNEAIQSLSLPHEVMPYVDAAMKIDREVLKAQKPTVAFFARRDGEDAIYLRVAPPKEGGQKVRAITAPLKNHRDYGTFTGLAAVPGEPITLGNPDDDRVLFDVFAGVFTATNIDVLLSKCCAEGSGAVGSNTPLRMDEIRALAYEGLLSEPLRIVRVAHEGSGVKMFTPPPSAAATAP
jgi:hypothetical protein